jgi:hypothetical protein
LSQSPSPGRSETGGAKSAGGAPTQSGYDPSGDLDQIGKLVADASEPSARKVPALVSALLPKLRTQDDSARARFELANAYVTIDGGPDRACPILLAVKDVPSVSKGASNMVKMFSCK